MYNRSAFIENDPVAIPHKFSKKEDIEIAGFFSAILSWGQRKTIISNANRLMELMDNSPYEFIMNSGKGHLKVFNKFKHRTFNPIDTTYFVSSLKNIYLNHGGLEKAFTKPNAKEGMSQFRTIFLSHQSPGRSSKHISDVAKNSSAKRINMYLRWMVRKDNRGVDFGLWKSIHPANLYCPLDVHSGRVARKLGLLTRKQDDWKAVVELTDALKRFDPKDPIKYDFALFGLGVFEKF